MNPNEIQAKKLILNFSKQYYEMENSKLFYEYCNFCQELTRNYREKLNENNKNNNLISNIHNLFCENMYKSRERNIKPTNFLNCGLDFNDDELLKYLEELIIKFK